MFSHTHPPTPPNPTHPQDLAAIRADTMERICRDPVLGQASLPDVRALTHLAAADAAMPSARGRMARSRAFTPRRFRDIEAGMAAAAHAAAHAVAGGKGGGGGGGSLGAHGPGLAEERAQRLVVEFRRRLLCMVKAYVGEQYNGFKLETGEAQELHEARAVCACVSVCAWRWCMSVYGCAGLRGAGAHCCCLTF